MINILQKFMQYSVIIVVTVLFSAGCSSNTATSDKTVVDTANQPVAAVEEPAVVEKPATVEEPVVVAEEPVEVEEAIDLTAKILALLDDSALAFVDNDNLKLRITGNVKLYAPEKLEQLVKKWVVYWSDGSEESGKTTKACESVVMEGIICGFAEEILTGDHFLAYAVDAAGNEYPKALSVEIVDAFVEVTEPVVIAEAPVVVETIAPSAPTPITILLENILYEFDKTTLQDDYMTYLDETFENSVFVDRHWPTCFCVESYRYFFCVVSVRKSGLGDSGCVARI